MSKRTRLLPVAVVAAVLAAVLVAAGCGSTSSATTTSPSPAAPGASASAGAANGGSTASVTIQNFAFSPSTLSIKPGTTVTWTNKDSVPHDVTSTNGPGVNATPTSLYTSGTMSTGQTFTFTYAKKGTYFYECKIHAAEPSMHAKVVVK